MMKHLSMIIFIGLLTAAMACKKTAAVVADTNIDPPQPISFELFGQDGKNLMTSINDKVTITYTSVSGATVTLPKVLVEKFPDTTASKKYNGLWINDYSGMSGAELSSGAYAPLKNDSKNFNIVLNGKSLGSIYLDYQPFINTYPALSSTALTLNNIPAVQDRNARYLTVWVFTAGN
jgi:ABC-type glycerol-3-phosphate transport system substrate-binding protein